MLEYPATQALTHWRQVSRGAQLTLSLKPVGGVVAGLRTPGQIDLVRPDSNLLIRDLGD